MAEGNGQRIEAMITDIMMPAMDGVALIRAVRALKPELKIIASSGLGTDLGGIFRRTGTEVSGRGLLSPQTLRHGEAAHHPASVAGRRA